MSGAAAEVSFLVNNLLNRHRNEPRHHLPPPSATAESVPDYKRASSSGPTRHSPTHFLGKNPYPTPARGRSTPPEHGPRTGNTIHRRTVSHGTNRHPQPGFEYPPVPSDGVANRVPPPDVQLRRCGREEVEHFIDLVNGYLDGRSKVLRLPKNYTLWMNVGKSTSRRYIYGSPRGRIPSAQQFAEHVTWLRSDRSQLCKCAGCVAYYHGTDVK